jgi:Flp pilus assembly pilin Flp
MKCFFLKTLLMDEQGGVLAEHGLMITLIAVACILAITGFAESVLALFNRGNILSFFL